MMEASGPLVRSLDSVDPFWNEDARAIFPPEAMRLLEDIPKVNAPN